MSSTRVTRSASTRTPVATPQAPAPDQLKTRAKRPNPTSAKPNEDSTEDFLHGTFNAIPNGTSKPLPPSTVPPSTPPAKRARKNPPPSTPTPAQIGLMAAPSAPSITLPSYHPTPRPAAPSTTNAPLKTPGGTRVVTYPNELLDASPSKTSLPRPTTTTDHLLKEACAHLIAVEPKLAPHPCRIFSPEGLAEEIDPWVSLASSIIGQQVSGAAAASIKRKFVGLFNEAGVEGASLKFPTPGKVAEREVEFLKTAGLSGRKAEYIKGLAEKFASGELGAKMLVDASYEEVLEKLIAVRGLGKWSVEMFACFALKRMDVFSTGDLGVQRGMAALMGKDVKKLKAKGGGKWKYMSEADMLAHSEKFAPYRSLFMWYMWRVEDVNVDAIQEN